MSEMFAVISCSLKSAISLKRKKKRICSNEVTYLSHAELCPPPGHSWALAGPRIEPSCPGSQKQSSTLPTCTESECDLFIQNYDITTLDFPLDSFFWGSSCCKRTSVSTQGVKALSSLTVCCVDVAVSSTSTDQDGSSTLRALHEGQVPDGTIMHAELQVWA